MAWRMNSAGVCILHQTSLGTFYNASSTASINIIQLISEASQMFQGCLQCKRFTRIRFVHEYGGSGGGGGGGDERALQTLLCHQ